MTIDSNENREYREGSADPSEPVEAPAFEETDTFCNTPETPVPWKPQEMEGNDPSCNSEHLLAPNSNTQHTFDDSLLFTQDTPQTRDAAEFATARKQIMAAQIMAIVSLFIGGVVLSTASVAVGALAMRKLNALSDSTAVSSAYKQTLQRSAKIATLIGAIALALNIVAEIILFPYVMQFLETGDISSLMDLGNPTPPADSLFG